jgi:hypothetical protein
MYGMWPAIPIPGANIITVPYSPKPCAVPKGQGGGGITWRVWARRMGGYSLTREQTEKTLNSLVAERCFERGMIYAQYHDEDADAEDYCYHWLD